MKHLFLTLLVGLSSLALLGQARRLRPQQQTAQAGPQEARVALVIGNGAYKDAPLRNPVNDAQAMANAVKACGFTVTRLENATRSQMREAIRAFGAKIAEGGVGLFYYAGHGMQVKGRNYLIPVGADIAQEDEVEGEAVEVDAVLAKMETARNRLNILILDACRDNPFGRSFRSSQHGLATMDAPTGTYVAFATAPGKTAADGSGANGMYTHALLRQLKNPGLRLEDVFKRTRAEVLEASGQKQTPWENSSIVGDFYFLQGSAPTPITNPSNTTATVGGEAPPPPAATAMVGYLQVMVNAPKAQVYVDGALKGTASPSSALNVRDLPVGSATLRVEAPGHKAQEQAVEIQEGQWTQAKLVLVKTTSPALAPAARPRPQETSGGTTTNAQGRPEMSVDLGSGHRMTLVQIAAGTFMMGSNTGDSNEKPAHEVTISHDFWMGKYDVTQDQWQAVMGRNPSTCRGADLPVEQVSWDDCQQFLSRLNAQGKGTFRLPTEAEWEYACRAGTTGERYGDLDAIAWYAGNSGTTSHPVGQKQANAFGLYDMNGNVWQWCQDWKGGYPSDSVTDPQGPYNGSYRVLRGGSWADAAAFARSAGRFNSPPVYRGLGLGFRVAALARTQ